MGLVAQVFDEGHLNSLRGHLAIGHTRYSTTGSSVWENAQPTFRSTATGSIALGHNGNLTNTRELLELVEKLAAESGQLLVRRRRPDPGGDAALARGHPRQPRRPAQHDRHRARDGAARVLPGPVPGAGRARGAAAAARRVLAGLHGRDDALRRPRPAGHPAAGARPAGARLGGRQRDRRAGHRRRVAGPRDRARRADRDRRARAALVAVRRGRAQGLPVRVRLPGPAGHQDRRPQGARHPGRGRPPAGRGGTRRGRPGDPGARVRHARPRSATRRAAASRTASAW